VSEKEKNASIPRRWQTGIVQNYAVTLVVGLIIILGIFVGEIA
jgi:hypothetical protein